MVNDFREYARMPAASLVPLNLNEFMETVLQLYHDAGHAISFVPGEGLPEIDADPAQLRQVFHNLISNSLEAVTEGELVRISIRTEAWNPNTMQAQSALLNSLLRIMGPALRIKS